MELEFSLLAGEAKGRKQPDWFVDGPDLFQGDLFFLQAFNELNTCRAVGMSIGAIPWRDIMNYAEYHNLDEYMTEVFLSVMRDMDNAYLNREKAKAEKE